MNEKLEDAVKSAALKHSMEVSCTPEKTYVAGASFMYNRCKVLIEALERISTHRTFGSSPIQRSIEEAYIIKASQALTEFYGKEE